MLAGDQLHELRPPGDLVWEHLTEPATVDALTAVLAARHVGDPDRIRNEVHDLLGQLDAAGAVRRCAT